MCKHRIDILNLFNYEVINHRILLIKAMVLPYSDCPTKSNVNLDIKGTADAHANYLLTDVCEENGRFNCLVDLGKESCDHFAFNFSICNANTCVNIVYKPKSSKYKVQPLLILAQDEHSNNVEINLKKIDLNMLLVQSTFADKLLEAGKGRITFDLVEKCQVLRCHLTLEQIWQKTAKELWEEILKAVNDTPGIYSPLMKYMTFINCTKYDGMAVQQSKNYSYDNIRLHLAGHATLASKSVAVFSGVFFYSWPQCFDDIYKCFLNTEPLDLSVYADESNYRRNWCGVYASTLGAVCHEIGHLFHLGHTANGLMGSGLDYINRVFVPSTLTEHLADRIFDHLNSGRKVITPPRCTEVRRNSENEFLKRYHEQRQHEGFYITSNCALILCESPWFRIDADDRKVISDEEFRNQCRLTQNIFDSPNIPIQLLEIRSLEDQFVHWYRETTSLKLPSHQFLLPPHMDIPNNYILFALSAEGHTAFFPKDSLVDNCVKFNDKELRPECVTINIF